MNDVDREERCLRKFALGTVFPSNILYLLVLEHPPSPTPPPPSPSPPQVWWWWHLPQHAVNWNESPIVQVPSKLVGPTYQIWLPGPRHTKLADIADEIAWEEKNGGNNFQYQ